MDEFEQANVSRDAFLSVQIPDFWGAFMKDIPPTPPSARQEEVRDQLQKESVQEEVFADNLV